MTDRDKILKDMSKLRSKRWHLENQIADCQCCIAADNEINNLNKKIYKLEKELGSKSNAKPKKPKISDKEYHKKTKKSKRRKYDWDKYDREHGIERYCSKD